MLDLNDFDLTGLELVSRSPKMLDVCDTYLVDCCSKTPPKSSSSLISSASKLMSDSFPLAPRIIYLVPLLDSSTVLFCVSIGASPNVHWSFSWRSAAGGSCCRGDSNIVIDYSELEQIGFFLSTLACRALSLLLISCLGFSVLFCKLATFSVTTCKCVFLSARS